MPALAALLAALLVAYAAPAHAADAAPLQWTQPQDINAAGSNGQAPQVAIADDGSAVAVWFTHDPVCDKDRIQFSTRVRGENFTAPPSSSPSSTPTCGDAGREATFLSDSANDAEPHVRLAMNKGGDAIAVWEEHQTIGTEDKLMIMSAYKPAGGTFGPEQVVEPGQTLYPSYTDPQVGIDGDGAATVIYHPTPDDYNSHYEGNYESRYVYRERPAGASSNWGNSDAVAPAERGNETDPIRYNERYASLSVADDGSRHAMVVQQQFHGSETHQYVYEMAKGKNDANWSVVGPLNSGINGGTVAPEKDDPEEDVTPRAVAGPHTIGAWTHGDKLEATYDSGPSPMDNFPSVLNTDGTHANTLTSGSTFAVDSNGLALALWSDGQTLLGNSTNSSVSGFGATDTDPVPGNGPDAQRIRPAIATDANGDSIAVFAEKNGDDETVQAAEHVAGTSTKFDTPMTAHPDTSSSDPPAVMGAPVAISPAGDLEDDDSDPSTGPKVAMNSDGEAVAVWARADTGDPSQTVEVSLLVPHNNPVIPPPPPPPPRPPAPIPNPINLARPLARDDALVLRADVTGPVDELRWSFGSKNEPPIVAKVVDGQLQRSVRLRLPDRSFTAHLTVVRPGGATENYSRGLTTLKPSSSAASKQVQAGVKHTDTPPVFAVGSPDSLTGKSDSCSPTTIWAGQQKLSGCFKPIEKLVDIPALERGAIHDLADQLGVDEAKTEVMQKATQLTDGYVAHGKALLNDAFPIDQLPVDPTDPKKLSQLVAIPEAKSLISAKAELPVGTATFNPKDGFDVKFDPKKADLPLGALPNPPKLPSLGGLEIVGKWKVDLKKREATIHASLKLPPEITKAGVRVDNSIDLRATPDSVIVDKAQIGPIDLDIGGMSVAAFGIKYDRAADEWDGAARACTLVATCINMAPPDGGIKISHGRVTFAGASVTFPPPGIQLFPGIDLAKIGFGMGFDPTRLVGSGLISALDVIGIEGKLVTAFPSAATPFVLKRDEVGPDFAPDLYGQSFTRPTVGLAGGAYFEIPETDERLEFARGYLLYEYPGYIALGGGGHVDLVGIIQLDGSLAAAVDIPSERFNVHGDVHACVLESDDLCGSAVANVSHGPNKEGGAGACIGIGPVHVGGGVQWARLDDPFIWPLDGCKWSRFAIDVRPSAAGAPSTYTMNVSRGGPNPLLRLYGKDKAPLVRVTGPGGQELDGTSARGLDFSPGGKIRILRFEGSKFARPQTVVGLENARPGRYTVKALPGSPAIVGSGHAHDLPDAKVSAHVTGKGRHRVLHYKVRRRTGQRVTFQELEPGGPAKAIGVTSGGTGKIHFNSAPGHGVRRIVAQFALADMPAERKLVTTFKPQSPFLPRPTRIHVRRGRHGLVVTWRRVAGARRYNVAALLKYGPDVVASTRRTHVTLRRVPRWEPGRVTVRARDDLRQSRVALGPGFRATAPLPTSFRPLYTCRIRGRRISCLAPASLRRPRPHKPRPHRHSGGPRFTG